MKLVSRIAAMCLIAAAPAAFAVAGTRSPCQEDPRAAGLPERIDNLKSQMSRIEWTIDRDERRRLMEMHMKVMHEGITELDRRQASDGCRVEMMHALMEQMMRHQLAAQDDPR